MYDDEMPEEIASKLTTFKARIQRSIDHDHDNYKYFNRMIKFICKTTLEDEERAKLKVMKKPFLESNETEIYVDQQLGEFDSQQPSFEVKVSSSVTDKQYAASLVKTAEVIEGYLRYKLSPRATDNMSWNTFADILRGGMSSWTIKSDWKTDDPYEFDMDIFPSKEHYPTMCGYDPASLESNGSDGEYCFKLVAYSKQKAINLYGENVIKGIKPSYSVQGLSWTYKDVDEEYYIFCDYYEKKTKKVNTVLLSNGAKILKSEYKKALLEWDKQGNMEQAPVVVQERKDGVETTICKYTLNDNKIVCYEETDYKYFPLFRFRCSVAMSDDTGSNKHDMNKSYVHNLVGQQKLKNTAMQGVAFEIINTMPHKFIMELDTIEETQMDALIDNQIPSVVIWKSKRKGMNSNDEPLPAPQIIARPPVPQIIPTTIDQTSMSMMRIMGAMDQNVQRNNVSGEAMDAGAIKSSKGSNPWWQAYIQGMNHAGTIFMDMIPKTLKTPTTIPIINLQGKKSFVSINDKSNPDSVMMNFKPTDFNIEISAGVNAEVMKRVSLNQMITMSKVSPNFAAFIDQKCMPEFIDNLDVRNKDTMVIKGEEWQEQMVEKAKKEAENKPMDPVQATMQIENAKLQQKQQELQVNTAIKGAEIDQKNRDTDIEFMKILSEIKSSQLEAAAKQDRAHSENVRSTVDLALGMVKHKNDARENHMSRAHEARMKSKDQDHAREMAASSVKEESDNL